VVVALACSFLDQRENAELQRSSRLCRYIARLPTSSPVLVRCPLIPEGKKWKLLPQLKRWRPANLAITSYFAAENVKVLTQLVSMAPKQISVRIEAAAFGKDAFFKALQRLATAVPEIAVVVRMLPDTPLVMMQRLTKLANLRELRFESPVDHFRWLDPTDTADQLATQLPLLRLLDFQDGLERPSQQMMIALLATASPLHTFGCNNCYWPNAVTVAALGVAPRALTSLSTGYLDGELLPDLWACGVRLQQLSMLNRDPAHYGGFLPNGLCSTTSLTALSISNLNLTPGQLQPAFKSLPLLREANVERMGVHRPSNRITITSASLTKLSFRGCTSLIRLRLRGSLSSQLQQLDLRGTGVHLTMYDHPSELGCIPTLLLDLNSVVSRRHVEYLLDDQNLSVENKRRIETLLQRCRFSSSGPLPLLPSQSTISSASSSSYACSSSSSSLLDPY